MTLFQITNPALSPALNNILSNSNPSLFFETLIPVLVGLALVIGVLIFLTMFLISGTMWIMSGDDKAKVQQAKERTTNAILGLVILFSTFAVLQALQVILGTNLIEIDLGFIIIH